MLIVSFLLFIAISTLVLYIPGFGVIARTRKRLADQEIIALALSSGIILFVLTAIILALLNIRYLMLPILLVENVVIILRYKLTAFKSWKVFIKNRILLALIIAGVIVQGLINFPSGYKFQNGLQFWSSQGHDGLWHVALMEEVKKSIPPQNPIFSGEPLYNYHYLVDILMGEFFRIFPFFSSLDLYFRFFPVIFSLLIGISVFAFVSRWQENVRIGYWAVFFTYFVGSFGYIVTFLKAGNIFGGETVFWAAQQNTLLGNPPHAVSHGLLASFLLSFLIYLKERKLIWLIISFLIGSTLAGFKVSAGLVMLTGVGIAAFVDLVFYRKLYLLGFAASLAVTNFLTFKLMTSKEASSFLMFLPWWFIRTMVVDKLGWIDLELRRQHYLAKGTWNAYLRVIQLEATAFLIFLVGNFGMRILGFYTLIKNAATKKIIKSPVDSMLVAMMLTGILMVVFFVQKGIIYNNIQFIQYSLFVMGFYSAVTTYQFLTSVKMKLLQVVILLTVVLLSVPTVIGSLNEFYGPSKTPLALISNQELEALKYLTNNSKQDEIILTVPFNKNLKDKFTEQPRPIYVWYSTPYVSALSARITYLTAEEQALITGYSSAQKLEKMRKFFSQEDPSSNKEFLKQEKIGYIYIVKGELIEPLSLEKNNLESFFENSEVIILKVKP